MVSSFVDTGSRVSHLRTATSHCTIDALDAMELEGHWTRCGALQAHAPERARRQSGIGVFPTRPVKDAVSDVHPVMDNNKNHHIDLGQFRACDDWNLGTLSNSHKWATRAKSRNEFAGSRPAACRCSLLDPRIAKFHGQQPATTNNSGRRNTSEKSAGNTATEVSLKRTHRTAGVA